MSPDNAKKIPPLRAVPEKDATTPALPFDSASAPDAEAPEDGIAPATCAYCFGSGMEVVAGKGARRCRCRTQDVTAKRLRATRIPPRYAECTLQNYYPDSFQPEFSKGSQIRARMKAKDLVVNYHNSYRQHGRGILFMGPVGVGKTHLAVGILNGLMEQGVECLFYEFGSLLKSIQDSYNSISRTSELGVLAPVFEAEVLVLDELGASMPTDWVRDTVAQIINKRYNDKKVTIFTTNYLDEVRYTEEGRDGRSNAILEKLQNEIAALKMSKPRNEEERETLERRLNEKVQYERQIRSEITPEQRLKKLTKLEDRIGVSMRSRLYEMCETILIQGADYRRKSRRPDQ